MAAQSLDRRCAAHAALRKVPPPNTAQTGTIALPIVTVCDSTGELETDKRENSAGRRYPDKKTVKEERELAHQAVYRERVSVEERLISQLYTCFLAFRWGFGGAAEGEFGVFLA